MLHLRKQNSFFIINNTSDKLVLYQWNVGDVERWVSYLCFGGMGVWPS